MRVKLLSTITAAMILSVSTAEANIDQFLNDAIVEVNTGKTIKTDEGTILYGGGLQMRAPTVNLQPFSVTAPSIKAGCGGIDLTFGALSYLNVDQIVAMLEGMMANAPGVMFEMALKVICPSCMDTLNALNEMANQINSMNMDSCSATKAAAGWLGEKANASLGTGTSGPDWLKTINESYLKPASTHLSELRTFLSGEGCNPSDKLCGARFFVSDVGTNSFLKYALEGDAQDTYFNNAGLTPMIRYFTGDIVKAMPTDSGGEAKQGSLKFYEPSVPTRGDFLMQTSLGESTYNSDSSSKAFDQNTKDIIRQLVGDAPANTAKAKGEDGTLSAFTYSGNLKTLFAARLDSIQNKILTRTALSSDDIGFLSMFQIPLYLITNRLASMPNGDIVLSAIKEDLALMLSYEVTYEYLARTRAIMSRQKEKMDDKTLEKIPYTCAQGDCATKVQHKLDDMIGGTRSMMMAAYSLAASSYQNVQEKLKTQVELVENLNQMQQFTMQRSNPRLFENYMFAKTLTTGEGR